jgi:peptidoglycan/LPS O-acetylase OafA/YrhL
MTPAETLSPITSEDTPESGRRFLVLDGLRGVAAAAVILDHIPSVTLGPLIPGRYLAVDFFFVLSGFVLAHRYGAQLAGHGDDARLRPLSFLRIRVARLYPLYLAGLCVGGAFAAVNLAHGWMIGTPTQFAVVTLFSLAFLPTPPLFSWTGSTLYPLNAPSWSLLFELIANLAFALLAPVLGRRVLWALLALAALGVGFGVLRQTVVGPGWLWPHFDAGLSRVLYGFFMGVAIHRARAWAPRLPAGLSVVLFVLVIAVPAVGVWRHLYDVATALVLAPLLVFLSVNGEVRGAVAKLCGTLGSLSYGVYVLHAPLGAFIGLASAKLPFLHLHGVVQVLLAGGGAAGLTVVIERMLHHLRRRRGGGPASRDVP